MIGGGGIFVNGVQSVSPPAGTSGLASNGLSVDSISGDYVLGNNIGDLAKPAALLSGREIQVDGNPILLIDTVGIPFGQMTLLPFQILMQTSGGGTLANLSMLAGNADGFSVLVFEGGGSTTITVGAFAGVQWVNVESTTGRAQHGTEGVSGFFNGATVQVNGSATFRTLPNFKDNTTYNISREDDSARLFVNSNGTGNVTLNLPDMASSSFIGFHIYVSIDSARTITLQAFAGQVIRLNGLTSSVAGTVSSSTVGSMLHLFCTGTTTWTAATFTGAWVLT